MINKIQLTQEQIEAVERFKELGYGYGMLHFSKGKGHYTDSYKPLNNLTLDEMARILYEPNSYELEQPQFKVGDVVVRTSVGHTFIVEDINEVRVFADGNSHKKTNLRHATTEEKFWFDLGRKFREVKKGDKIVIVNGWVFSNVDMIKQYLDEDNEYVDYYYPVESRLEFPNG